MTSPFHACRDGIRRVNRAPSVLIGAWILSVLVSLPLALLMSSLIQEHLGGSLAAGAAADGVNDDWMQEFAAQSGDLGSTLRPGVIGFAAVVDNLSAFLDNSGRPLALIMAAWVYVVLWLFLAGGAVDRYARDRATHAHGFFMTAGVFFFRFLRLGVLMAVVYGLLFGLLHPWMFNRVFPRFIHDVTVERTAFFIRVGFYAAFGLILVALTIVFDFAKVRAVVEDRRSMLGAVASAMRFIGRNVRAVVGLYLMNAVLFLLVLAVYAVIAPGAAGSGWHTWMAVLVGQLYVLARSWVKLVFWASETALFQSRLAHAGYVAAPQAVWPDSPSVEAVER